MRPDYAPLLTSASTEAIPGGSSTASSAILGFYREVSDDGKWALMEIVARDRASLAPLGLRN